MFILEKRSTIQEIKGTGDYPNGFVKGVVDIENRKVALNADTQTLLIILSISIMNSAVHPFSMSREK